MIQAEGDLTCEYDSKPAPTPEDNLYMEYQEPGGIWTNGTSPIITADEITSGTLYRCVYINADLAENSTMSGIIHMVAGSC